VVVLYCCPVLPMGRWAGARRKLVAHSDDLTPGFNLRKGVKFHNGREFNAEDVKFSLHAYWIRAPVTGAYVSVVDREDRTVSMTIRSLSRSTLRLQTLRA